ncbi:C4-dicarboxylate TRAP transporter substrate-binding protein [Flaviflexus massiliensis]|uniref:C4-dicarboxylate TRAP transporter substrate-binding protein n=1 Tax=Flaviflexus massiliensis TaxID=1522309 RepID=UPI0006D52AB5|nr:C4-dicarboxylate TRAP transporter substrate-binding protein [Flaviflexus massiliensis]
MARRKGMAATLIAGLALATTAACSESDAEYVLHYTTYSSSSSDQSRSAQRWAEEVEKLTDGEVQVVFHYSQSLVGADETVQATLDGRADVAQVGSIYAASDLSMYTVIELPFETQNPEAHMRTIFRLYEESPGYRDDFDRQGVRLLFPLPLGIMAMGLNEPAYSPDDLSGRSIRSGGLASEVLLDSGVNPVAMTATDIYESMERGIVDGYTALALANLSTFGLTKVSPYIVDPGIGAYSSSIVVINEELYQSMPKEYQDAIDQASAMGIDFGLEEMDVAAKIACDELDAAGSEFISFSDADVEAWAEESKIADEWVARYDERGYDAQSVLDDYREILADEETKSDYDDPLVACMGGTL